MNQRRGLQIAYLITGILAFSYILARAVNLGITYDEGWTISEFVPETVMHIINFTPPDANNHIANTLLIKLLFSFGNKSLLIARLPNLLAFGMYLYFAVRLTYSMMSSLAGFSAFLLLFMNPFLLDFFSLARGYGLALGFLMASVYFLLLLAKEFRIAYISWSLITAFWAVLSNFSMLNYFLAALLIITILGFYAHRRQFPKTLIISALISGVLLLTIYEPIRKLKETGKLYYGGETGFYTDTLVSLAKYSLYTPEVSSRVYLILNSLIVLFLIVVICSFFIRRPLISATNIICSITSLCVLSTVLQHYMLGTLYLIDRTALFFYVLFILSFCFALNELPVKWYSKITVFLLVGSFFINFVLTANFYKTVTWFFDSHTSSILARLDKQAHASSMKAKLAFSWPFRSSVNYYFKKNRYAYLETMEEGNDPDSLRKNCPYYIYLNTPMEKDGLLPSVRKHTFIQKRYVI